jgi:hypothetical protein
VVVLAAVGPRPAAAAGGPGQSAGCPITQLISVTAQKTYDKPQAAVSGQAATCYLASGEPGQRFGTQVPRSDRVLPQAGTQCWRVIYERNSYVVNGDGSVTEFSSSPDSGAGSYNVPTGFGNFMGLWYVGMAAQSNVYNPFLGNGTVDNQGNCVVPPVGMQGNGQGWEAGCRPPGPPGMGLDPLIQITGLTSQVCVHTDNNPVAGAAQAVAPRLVADLRNVRGLVDPGTIVSMPKPAVDPATGAVIAGGIVNAQTCFWVMPPADPKLNAFHDVNYDLLIPGPPDGNNRVVHYTFRITVTAPQITWRFDDGSTKDDGQAVYCAGQNTKAVLSAGHIYQNYNTSGYKVTVEEHYGMTINEYWYDTQAHGPIALDPVALGVPPIDLVAGPYSQPVIQEMGVPIGGPVPVG